MSAPTKTRAFPIPHEPVSHASGRHNVITCRKCGEHFVRVLAVQVMSAFGPSGHEEIQHVTVWTVDGEVAEEPPTAGRDAANNRRPRVALTFECDQCGHTWAAVITHHLGQTFAYASEPTAAGRRAR